MTPKLRLSEHARKTLLSCMRKLRWPGMRWTTRSTQMTLAPRTQAATLLGQRSALWDAKQGNKGARNNTRASRRLRRAKEGGGKE